MGLSRQQRRAWRILGSYYLLVGVLGALTCGFFAYYWLTHETYGAPDRLATLGIIGLGAAICLTR